jgi:XTP/dITP diphosphohydrolase
LRLGFITSNKGKLLELQTSLVPLGHDVIQLNIDYPELQANTIEVVARFGLEWIINNVKTIEAEIDGYENLDLIFLEDSGLFIDALNSFPGVYSKYVFTTIGLNGVLELLKGKADRKAHFESCIAVCKPKAGIGSINEDNKILCLKGICNGTISTVPKGDGGFGYDPIFQPDGEERTFAEMVPEEKNRLSHRGKAIDNFVQHLKTL